MVMDAVYSRCSAAGRSMYGCRRWLTATGPRRWPDGGRAAVWPGQTQTHQSYWLHLFIPVHGTHRDGDRGTHADLHWGLGPDLT